MTHPLELLGAAFAEQNVRVLLIGAFAVHAHGVSRQTFDMDFITTDSDFAAISRILCDCRYQAISGPLNLIQPCHS